MSEILQESERIKELLLPAQAAVHDQRALDEDALATEVRRALGYGDPMEPGSTEGLVDTRVDKQLMVSPRLVAGVIPLTELAVRTTAEARQAVANIHMHRDSRVVAAIGECSVHNPEATIEYAQHARRFQYMFPNLLILQRTFFEKPRTPVRLDQESPWKGFIPDPDRDGSYDINKGVIAARMIVAIITNNGQPTIMEQLNALTAQYLDGGIAQYNTGARNVSDQKAVELASASSAASGHKNGLDGNIATAVQAAAGARRSHSFLGVDSSGMLSIVRTTGNETSHIILRGGNNGPNYTEGYVDEVRRLAGEYGLTPVALEIDASHGNSGKKAANQPGVIENVAAQIAAGEQIIRGVQMESALVAGKQSFVFGQPLEELVYGQSITDECMGLEATEKALYQLDEAAAKRREQAERPLVSARRN